MPEPRGQLPLQFRFNDRQIFESYQPGANGELLARLQGVLADVGFSGAWLWGEMGAGTTHLLNAACHRAGSQAAYLPLAQLPQEPEILEGLDRYGLVVLDDAHAWLGNVACETAIVGLYQGLLGRRARLLCGARAPAARLDFALADLRSRFAALPAYRVIALDDAGKRRLLREHAATRGLTLSDKVLDYWLARSDRSVPSLLSDLERLDQAALSAQRTVTVPLVKATLRL